MSDSRSDLYTPDADGLLAVLRKLRSPSGCPWDRKQTRQSLVRHLDGECADLYNPKTIRAAMGAIFRQKITVCSDLPETIGRLRQMGCRIYAAALGRNSVRLDQLSMDKNTCFIIGNEGHGLSDEVIEACTACVRIPMAGNTESLNAASAAVCILWESYRKFR